MLIYKKYLKKVKDLRFIPDNRIRWDTGTNIFLFDGRITFLEVTAVITICYKVYILVGY